MLPYTLAASSGTVGRSYIVCAMFTRGYKDKADRLIASLRALNLEYAVYEVPAVHRSVSPAGTDDLSFSKPNFIAFVMRQFEKPVLYVDADMAFRQAPLVFDTLRDDFAICNWLANDATDAWVPAPHQDVPRYWTFSHAIDDWSVTQMVCSGCVQWWAPTAPARALLDRWRDALVAHPHVPDDHALDVAFNHFPPGALRVKWLPKEYARYAFWIFTRPVIDHPELPAPLDYQAMLGARTIASRIIIHAGKTVPLPRTMIIDTQIGTVLARNGEGQAVPWAPLQMPLYLPDQENLRTGNRL